MEMEMEREREERAQHSLEDWQAEEWGMIR